MRSSDPPPRWVVGRFSEILWVSKAVRNYLLRTQLS